MHKFLFSHVQILEIQCFFMIVGTNKSKIGITQLQNLVKLRINGESNLAGEGIMTGVSGFPVQKLRGPW